MAQSFVCDSCASFGLDRINNDYSQSNRKASIFLDALKENKSCATCIMLYQGVCGVVGNQIGRYQYLSFKETAGHAMTTNKGPLRLDLWPKAQNTRRLKLQFYTHFGPTRDIFEKASSTECLDLASTWLKECVDEHSECKSSTDLVVPPLPTRVIDIDTGDDLRLLITDGQQARYAALSHCWGGGIPIVTTTSTLETYKRRIKLTDLPPTFQDAVTVTRKLGIQYLWIDSLCILQDSEDDWARESSKMASVYENALITIAADAATNCSTGFLLSEYRINRRVARVQYSGLNGASVTVHVREKGPLAGGMPYHGWHDVFHPDRFADPFAWPQPSGPARSKLSTRGWVFQERVLSPRTIHFASEEMGWECRTKIYCECSADSLRMHRTTSMLKGSLLTSWEKIITEYTKLDLTKISDRLPALSGLAAHVHRVRGDEYICGLWRRDISKQLLWRADNYQQKESKRQEKYIAPTWSWASITGNVSYPDGQIEVSESFSVLKIDLELQNELNPYGPTKTAQLEIEGVLVQLSAKKIQAYYNRSPYEFSYTSPIKGLNSPHVLLDIPSDELDVAFRFYFLLVGESRSSMAHYGLILKRCEQNQIYERIGRGDITYSKSYTIRGDDSYSDWSSDEADPSTVVIHLPTKDGKFWKVLGEPTKLVIV